MKMHELSTAPCDYHNPRHLQAVATLLNGYIEDGTGGGTPLSDAQQAKLLDDLSRHPSAIVLLAESDGIYCGLLVAFENYSTFTVSPMINIHDVFVPASHRGRGVGRRLMTAIVAEAEKRNCSRLTLEVLSHNIPAQNLYRSVGFDETEPPHYYWRKYLK
jgi:ribosomal protein S18 acetylase RimI-like enzyme